MAGQFNPLSMLAQPQRPRLAQANDPAELYGLQGEFGDETEMRSIMAEKAGSAPNEINALNRLAGSWRTKQASTMAGMMPTPFQTEQTSAINEGFGGSELHDNPVIARNLYKRNFEQEKMRQPLEQTKLQEAGSTQRQNIASGAQRYVADRGYEEGVDVEEIRQAPQNTYAETQRMLLLDENGQPRTNRPVDSVSKNSINFQNQPNQTTANNQLAMIRGLLVKKGGVPFLNQNNPTQEQAEYNSYVTGIISTASMPPEVKQEIVTLLQRPESASMSIQQLIESLPFNPAELDDNEYAALTDLFMRVKG